MWHDYHAKLFGMACESYAGLFTDDFAECVSPRGASPEANKANCSGSSSSQGLSPGIIILQNTFGELLA